MPKRRITAVGQGSAQSAPDQAAIAFSAHFSANSANDALEGASRAADAMTRKAQEFRGTSVTTSGLGLHPDWRDGKESGYRAEISLTVLAPTSESIGELITAMAAQAGDSARINHLSFTHSDPGELASRARAAAFQDALNRATQYAELAGAQLGAVISIDEGPVAAPSPTPRMMAKSSAADAMPVPIEAGSLGVEAQVTVCWELR